METGRVLFGSGWHFLRSCTDEQNIRNSNNLREKNINCKKMQGKKVSSWETKEYLCVGDTSPEGFVPPFCFTKSHGDAWKSTRVRVSLVSRSTTGTRGCAAFPDQFIEPSAGSCA